MTSYQLIALVSTIGAAERDARELASKAKQLAARARHARLRSVGVNPVARGRAAHRVR
jgi:hypothetical protein